MATATLVKEARLQGWRVLEAIHGAANFDFDVQAAFWLYDEERETWRFYIVTPQVAVVGPLRLYRELRRIISEQKPVPQQNVMGLATNAPRDWYANDEEENLTLDDITFIGPNDPVARDMRRRHGNVPFDPSIVRRVSLTRDEPYIYQL